MSFSRELKDFVEGYKTGEDIKKGWTEQKYREAQIENERNPTEAEKNKPGGPLSGSSAPGGAIPNSPAGSVGGSGDPTVFDGFMNGVKKGVTNPYALAAIAATGHAESGYSATNASSDWQDGKNRAGGIMSWNGDRLANLRKFNGGQNGTPEQQAAFFLQEDPELIKKLNSAKSLEEAQALMNGAWRYSGYDPKGDAQGNARLQTAKTYLPKFETGMASADTGGGAMGGAIPDQPGIVSQADASRMDDKIVRVTNRAARDNPNLFTLSTEGGTVRTPAQQAEFVRRGASKTMKSKHLEGKAVDLVPINPRTGKPDPNYTQGYGPVNAAMMKAAKDEGVNDLTWGGNWKSFTDMPHFQVSMLDQSQGDPNAPQGDPNAPQGFGDQQTLFSAQGGVIPEPQYFQDGGTPLQPNPVVPQPNPNNPSNTAGGGDQYSSFRNYTQKIQPSAPSSFTARRVGQAAPGVTYAPPMQMTNGMTPSQLAYKQAGDQLTQQRQQAAATAAAQNQARLDAESRARIAAMKPAQPQQPLWGQQWGFGTYAPNSPGRMGSNRAEGGMVYHNFDAGGVIPDGGPEPQAAAPSSNADPYNSEYWTPVGQQAGQGYQEGGYVDPMAGTDIPSPYTVQRLYSPYSGAIPEEYLGSREEFDRQSQGDPYYAPDATVVAPPVHYPTVAQDQNYIYRDAPPSRGRPRHARDLPEDYRGSREQFDRQSQGDRAYRPPPGPPPHRYPTVAQDQNYTYRDRPPPGRDVRRDLPEDYRGSREQFDRQSQGDRAYRPPPPPPGTRYPTVAQDQNYDYRNAQQGPPRDVRRDLPEDYRGSREQFDRQSQGDRAYRPPVAPEVHYPTVAQDQNYTYQNELPPPRPPTSDDSAYAYDNEPMDRRSSRFEGTDPRSAPVTTPSQPRFVYPTIARDQDNPVIPEGPGRPTPPHDRTPNLIPGQETYGSADRPAAPGQPQHPHTPTPPTAALNMVPPLDRGVDRTKTGSTKRDEPKHQDAKPAAKKAPAPPPRQARPIYNDPYEREKETFATRDQYGRPLPARHFAEGGAIPDAYQNEGSMFAAPQAQAAPQPAPQAAPQARPAPPPAGVDRTQTGSIPPDSSSAGPALGAPSTHKPTPSLLRDVGVALHHGVQFLQDHFGLRDQGAVPTPDGQQQTADGARRFASGEGATTPDEVNAIDNNIDPNRRMPEGDRQMQRLANVVQFYLERGQKDKASAAAAGLMQYGAQRTQQYGSLAAAAYQKYLQTHDPADLQKTTQILQGAYSMIPNGGDYGVTMNPETHQLEVSHTDDQGKVTTQPLDPNQLPDIIKGVQDKSLYWGQIQLLADPEGVHQRDRDKLQSAEWTRQHGITHDEELGKEGRSRDEWTREHDITNTEEIEKEKRAAEAEAQKEERAATAKEAEHQRTLAEQLEQEKRQAAEDDRRAKRNAAIDIAKKEDKTTDWDAVSTAASDANAAATDKDPQTDQKMSKLWDSLPEKDRSKRFEELTGLTFNNFKYLPKTAGAMLATGDAPPANYPGKQPGDVVKKGADPQGNPLWVVTRNGQNSVIPAS